MSKRLLQHLRGVGQVYAGEHLLRTTPYELSIWSDPAAAGEDSPAAVRIEGHIDVTAMGEALVLAGASALTLLLEDGRRLAFTLLGTGGRIAADGALPPAR